MAYVHKVALWWWWLVGCSVWLVPVIGLRVSRSPEVQLGVGIHCRDAVFSYYLCREAADERNQTVSLQNPAAPWSEQCSWDVVPYVRASPVQHATKIDILSTQWCNGVPRCGLSATQNGVSVWPIGPYERGWEGWTQYNVYGATTLRVCVSMSASAAVVLQTRACADTELQCGFVKP